jgi:hypothetical protein
MVRLRFEQWPILLTELADPIELSEVDGACRGFEQAFAKRERFVSILDASQLGGLPAPILRQRYATWRALHFRDLEARVIAVAYVLGNRPALRGALTAVSWIARHPAPQAYFAHRTDAWVWARLRLNESR